MNAAKIDCSLICKLLALLALLQVIILSDTAVGRQVSSGPGLNEASQSESKFRSLSSQILKNEAEISRLYSSIPLGFVKEQQAHLDQINVLKEATAEFRKQLDQAALEAVQADSKNNPQAVDHAFGMVVAKIDGKGTGQAFDPAKALEIADSLVKSGFAEMPVLYQAFRACYAMQDFNLAQKYLDDIETAGGKFPDNIRALVTDSKSKWEREIGIRSTEEAANDLPQVKFITSEGEFIVELFENQAPQTVANFISLVESKFYDGLTFHLVRPAQFAQTGCPKGDGSGHPGYRIANETTGTEMRNFFAGTLGMSQNGPDTAGSQFFISHQPNAEYDPQFVAFGRVIEGLNVVFSLKRADQTVANPITKDPSKIITASVIRKRDHVYEPIRLPNPETTLETTPATEPVVGGNNPSIPDVAPKKDSGR